MRRRAFSPRRLSGLYAILAVVCCAQKFPQASCHLVSPLRRYSLKLESFVPTPGRAIGVLLKARINGGRPLRLVLDSGAEHVVLSSSTARAVGLPSGPSLSLVGFGRMEAGGSLRHAGTVEVGPLTFHDCAVDVVTHKVVEGADGVLPLVLFSDFLVALDFPRKDLELSPYQSTSSASPHFTRALAVNAVLFLRTALNERHDGYFLLDTGAAHNAISRRIGEVLGGPGVGAPTTFVRGAAGLSEVQQMRGEVRFRTAGQEITSNDVVMVDLDTISRYNGLEVAGLLGYPALKEYVVTVNYRDALVRMEGRNAIPESQ